MALDKTQPYATIETADAIAIRCDGTVYTVYQPGDTVPAQ